MKTGYDTLETPIGEIYIEIYENKLTRIELFKDIWLKRVQEYKIQRNKEICKLAKNELDEYFCGKRRYFTIPLLIDNTDFRKKVYNELLKIPYGEVRTYKEVAESIGKPKGARAIGQANRNNNIPIVIPCHRVIGKDFKMIGYSGDNIWIQKYLLELENKYK